MSLLVGATLACIPLVPGVTVQDDLAHPDGLGRYLNALIVIGEVQGLLQAHLDGRGQGLQNISRGGAHVGHVLLQGDVDIQVPGLVVDADDLSLVNRRLRIDEEVTTGLELLHGVGAGLTRAVGDHDPF